MYNLKKLYSEIKLEPYLNINQVINFIKKNYPFIEIKESIATKGEYKLGKRLKLELRNNKIYIRSSLSGYEEKVNNLNHVKQIIEFYYKDANNK